MGSVLRKTKIFRIISRGIIYALIFSLVCPPQAWAARSSAGGGKIAKPDWGKVATNVGITVGAAVIGSALSSSFNSAWQTANPAITQGSQVAAQSTDLFTKFGNFITDIPSNVVGTFNATGELIANPGTHFAAGFGSMSSLSQVAPIIIKGYATYAAGTQVARAVGMAGSYYGWSPKATFALSSMAVGATGGFLNPSAALGETLLPTTSIGSAMVKGAFVGGLSGWATGATIGAIDGDKLNKGKSPGTTAQLAGLGAGIFATELGKTLVNPRTYDAVWAEVTKEEYNFDKPVKTDIIERDNNGNYKISEIAEGPDISPSYEEYVKSGGSLGSLAGKGPLSEPYYNERMSELIGTTDTGIDIGIRPKEFHIQETVLTPKQFAELSHHEGVRIEWTDEGGGIMKIGHPEVNYVSKDGKIRFSEDELMHKIGGQKLEVMLKHWNKDPAYSLSAPDALQVLQDSDKVSISNYGPDELHLPGRFKVTLSSGGQQLSIPLTAEEINSAYTVMPSYPRPDGKESYFFITGQPPTNSQILDRIIVGPFVRTVDQWPLIVTRALSLNATKGDSKWNPLISEAIYATAAPLLDNFATIYNLKLGLATNIDEKLGYYPALKVQRQQMYAKAWVDKVVQEAPKDQEPAKFVKVNVDTGNGEIQERYRPVDDVFNKEKELSVAEMNTLQDVGFAISEKVDITGKEITDKRIMKVEKPELAEGTLRLVKISEGRYRVIDDVFNKDIEFTAEEVKVLQDTGFAAANNKGRIIDIWGSTPDILPSGLKVQPEERSELNRVVWAKYLKAISALTKTNPDEYTLNKERFKLLSASFVEGIKDQYKNAPDQHTIFKNIGGKDSDLLLTTANKVFTYELPVALISGSIQVAMNDYLDDKSPYKAMWASLGATAATSVARGIVWNAYAQDLYTLQKAQLLEGRSNPMDVGTEYIPISGADRVFADIARGEILEGTPTRFSIEREFRDGKKTLTPEEISALKIDLNWLNKTFNLDLSPEEINITSSEADFAKIQQRIKEKVDINDILREEPDDSLMRQVLPKILDSIERTQQTIIPIPDEKGLYTLAPGVVSIFDKDNKNKYTGYYVTRTPHQVDANFVYRNPADPTKLIEVPREEAEKHRVGGLTVDTKTNTISPLGRYEFNGAITDGYYLATPPGLGKTIVGSLSQGLFEFGWQSLAMGLPYTYQGKMGSYAWVNYQQNLHSLTRNAAMGGGIFNTMAYQATEVGKDLVARNTLTTIADTPLGKWLGMAPFIPVSGYKGMPFSIAVNIETGLGVQTMFYPYWPYQRLGVIPHDAFWRQIRSNLASRYTSQPFTPQKENNGLLEK